MKKTKETVEERLDMVKQFIQEGQENGTLEEAVLWAIDTAQFNPQMTLDEILNDAASEWYK